MNTPAAAPAPRIRIHRAGAGLDWVRQGLRLFARQPLVLLVVVGLGPLFLGTLQVVPVLGDFAAFVLTPAIALGMLNVCRIARQGAVPAASTYVLGLRDPLARLRVLQLGLVYAVFAGMLVLVASLLPAAPVPNPESVSATSAVPLPQPARAPESAPALPGGSLPAAALSLLVAVLIPFAMAVWFAPALAGWHRMAVPKALFFSFFACWRNRWPILAYLVTLLGIWVIGVMVVGTLMQLLNAKEGLAPYLLLAPLLFLTLTISQCANLVMVESIIDDGSGTGSDTQPEDGKTDR